MKLSRKTLIIIAGLLLIGILFYARKYYWYPIENRNSTGDVIVALGDSLTYGTGAQPGEDWPSLLAERCNCTVINKGVPGETSAQAYERLDSVLQLHPRIVIVGLGGNDILRQLPREEMFANIRRIVDESQDAGAMVVVLGLNGFPLDGGLGSGYGDLARETGSVYVPNILGGIFSNPNLKADQLHPNAAGYRIMADKIYDAVKPYL